MKWFLIAMLLPTMAAADAYDDSIDRFCTGVGKQAAAFMDHRQDGFPKRSLQRIVIDMLMGKDRLETYLIVVDSAYSYPMARTPEELEETMSLFADLWRSRCLAMPGIF